MGPSCYSSLISQTNCTWKCGHVQWYIIYIDDNYATSSWIASHILWIWQNAWHSTSGDMFPFISESAQTDVLYSHSWWNVVSVLMVSCEWLSTNTLASRKWISNNVATDIWATLKKQIPYICFTQNQMMRFWCIPSQVTRSGHPITVQSFRVSLCCASKQKTGINIQCLRQ